MNILIITNDLLSERMASPAIRCWEISRVLGKHFETTLACSNKTLMKHENFRVESFQGNSSKLSSIASEHDVIIIHPYTLSIYPVLSELGKILVMDLYAPFILEKLETYDETPLDERLYTHSKDSRGLIEQVSSCDYFLCASSIQKRFWYGMLSNLFPSIEMKDRIIIIPFGLPEDKPVQHERPLAKRVKNDGDFLLIWGGGIWNWFDTKVIIDGMKVIKGKRPDIKIFFMSAKHPHPAMPSSQHRLLNWTIKEAENSELLGKNIFFNDKWIPYNDRCNFLLEADAGLSCHHNHLETRFSFRTRLLDYIWCNLPMICTEGDSISRIVHERMLGFTIPESDPDAFVESVIEMTDSKEKYGIFKRNLDELAPEFYWETCVKPLLDSIENFTPKSISFSNIDDLDKYIYLEPKGRRIQSADNRFKTELNRMKNEGFSYMRNILTRARGRSQ